MEGQRERETRMRKQGDSEEMMKRKRREGRGKGETSHRRSWITLVNLHGIQSRVEEFAMSLRSRSREEAAGCGRVSDLADAGCNVAMAKCGRGERV